MSNICESLEIWAFSLASPCAAHTLCLLGSTLHHYGCCSRSSQVLASPKMQEPLVQWGGTFISRLSWSLFMVWNLNFSSWCLHCWDFNCYWGWTAFSALSWPLTGPNVSTSSQLLDSFKASTTWVNLSLPNSTASMRYNLDFLQSRKPLVLLQWFWYLC